VTRALAAILFVLLAAVTVLAEEKPAPPTAWEIVGNENVRARNLERAARRELRRLSKTGSDVFADDAAFMMQNHLGSEGYALGKVTYEQKDGRTFFVVTEGPRFFIGRVTVTGSEIADPRDLAAFVPAETTWFFGLGRRILLTDNLESAASRMRAFLRQKGHLDAEVRGPFTVPSIDALADMDHLPAEITLDVGYRVRDNLPATFVSALVTVSGASRFRPELVDRVARLLDRPWTPYTVYRIQSLVADHLGEQGYPYAVTTVTPEFRHRAGRVEVDATIDVTTGPVVTIGQVHVGGNLRTKDHVVRRELEFAPGSIVSTVDIRESQRNLFDLGYFRQAAIEIDRDVRPEEARKLDEMEIDVGVLIEEGDLRRLEFSVGYGSWEKIRGSIAYTIFNALASGYDLTAELSASTKDYEFLVRGTNPWFLSPRIRGTFEVSVRDEERPTFSYYRRRLSAALSKKFQRKHEVFARWSFDRTDVFEVSGDLPPEFENVTNVSSITLGATSDTRVTKWDPRRGGNLTASVQWASDAIGSELDFFRPRASATGFHRFFSDWIFAWRAEFAWTIPYGGTVTMPVQERFYLGGSQTVRSFKQDDLGPRAITEGNNGLRQSDLASGGEFYSLANAEVRIPLVGGLETCAFVDMGNVIRFWDEDKIRDYRFAIGTGLRYRTPLGPIRVDWGWNPSPRDHEDQWMIYLAVGYPF